MAWNWQKKQKCAVLGIHSHIQLATYKVQSLQPQIQRVLCATSKLFWPHCAAACMLDGETTLLNTELGQPLPLHSEI